MPTALRTVLTLSIAYLAAPSAGAAELVPLAGPPRSGSLVQVDPQVVTFKVDGTGELVKIPVKELAAVDLKNKPVPPGPGVKFDAIELVDGSTLRVTAVKIKGKAVEVAPLASRTGPAVDLPLAAVFWLVRGADDPANAADWAKLVAGRGKRDLFVARAAGGLNPVPGTVVEGSPAGDRVSFEREDGQRVNLPLARATGGIVFNQPPRDVIPPTVCKVVDVSGNVWFAAAVEVVGSGLKVKTVSGAAVEYPDATEVAKLDFSQGNVAYLSDLTATADAPPAPPDEPLDLKPSNDRPVIGTEIAFHGKRFAKGIGVPRDTTLTYKIDAGFREFKATAGIPDGPNRDGWTLRLRVEIDGRAVLDEPVARAAPREINLSVKDAKELRVTVTADGPAATGFEIDLADARFQK